jgi:hypothetical protein
MPVREMNQLNRRKVRSQPVDIPLPHILFRARVKEHRMPLVSFCARLRSVKLLTNMKCNVTDVTHDHQGQAMRSAANLVHSDFLRPLASAVDLRLRPHANLRQIA